MVNISPDKIHTTSKIYFFKWGLGLAREFRTIERDLAHESRAVSKVCSPSRSDLSSVKCEILSMTEQYSVKCLENATLQEKLEIMNQQLKSTTTQVNEITILVFFLLLFKTTWKVFARINKILNHTTFRCTIEVQLII